MPARDVIGTVVILAEAAAVVFFLASASHAFGVAKHRCGMRKINLSQRRCYTGQCFGPLSLATDSTRDSRGSARVATSHRHSDRRWGHSRSRDL
jgi:hypothetical protein